MDPSHDQLARLCRIARDSSARGAGASLRELLAASGYRGLRPSLTETGIAEYLGHHPELVTQWSMYSENKRTTGGWYFTQSGYVWIVGRLGSRGARSDERTHDSRPEAGAQFILLELDFWSSLPGA